jgi:hypothetical protein
MMVDYIYISVWGIIYLCCLFIPNIIWTHHMPQGYSSQNESKLLLYFERIGEVLVSFFAVIQFQKVQYEINGLIIASIVCMLIYEGYWIHYFCSQKTLQDFYQPFLKIPLPGAVLPVVAFVLLSIYQQHILLFVAIIILAIGHIGIHYQHYRELS